MIFLNYPHSTANNFLFFLVSLFCINSGACDNLPRRPGLQQHLSANLNHILAPPPPHTQSWSAHCLAKWDHGSPFSLFFLLLISRPHLSPWMQATRGAGGLITRRQSDATIDRGGRRRAQNLDRLPVCFLTRRRCFHLWESDWNLAPDKSWMFFKPL